jgi:hypothetical protein
MPVRGMALVPIVAFLLAENSQPQVPDVSEASGIVRYGDELLIVADSDPGAYYRFPVQGPGPIFPVQPSRLVRVEWSAAALASDLEEIDVLADGRIVVLSERLRSLVDERGVVTEYDDPVADFGERGLEGLAVRHNANGSSRVSVLWEGGYPSARDLPQQLVSMARTALRPVMIIHDLAANATRQRHRMDRAAQGEIVELQTPLPPGNGLRHSGLERQTWSGICCSQTNGASLSF